MRYVRFILPSRDKDSHRREGLFQVAYRLRNSQQLSPSHAAGIECLLRWFNEHLPVPNRFSRSRRPHSVGHAVCWLKDTAVTHIRIMRSLAEALGDQGLAPSMICTCRPGYIVYEDAWQVAAVPFADTVA